MSGGGVAKAPTLFGLCRINSINTIAFEQLLGMQIIINNNIIYMKVALQARRF
jgi:hypothetical protein